VTRLVRRACVLWPTTVVSFATVESYLHWRAGLGFHGLHCVVGPVHENVLPIAGALSLVGSSALAGATHLLRWMRCRLADAYGYAARAPRALGVAAVTPLRASCGRAPGGSLGARGPPLLVVG
jgi:hypothetical protein